MKKYLLILSSKLIAPLPRIRFYKLIFILLVILQGKMLVAQPIGFHNAVWHYSLQNQMPPYDIIPVTITAGTPYTMGNYQVVSVDIDPGSCATDTSYVLMESNDSVYYFLPQFNQFAMLY